MRRIDTKQAAEKQAAEKPRRRRNGRRLSPGKGAVPIANFTPMIDDRILRKAEERGAEDGFPYLRDIILVLLGLYGRGLMGADMRRGLSGMISEWAKRAAKREDVELHRVKRNFKLNREIYKKAIARWKQESSIRAATAMFAFLLDSYGSGEIELMLVRGRNRKTE
jgi:hypothetical protein